MDLDVGGWFNSGSATETGVDGDDTYGNSVSSFGIDVRFNTAFSGSILIENIRLEMTDQVSDYLWLSVLQSIQYILMEHHILGYLF